VLKIDWGKYERPGDLPNFESLARRYRFQTLGRACRDRGIDSLFLAHHEDDQAETVMMRMINGHRRFGLVGMKRDSEIPECHGIHGVHESGGLNNTLNQTITNSSASLTQDLQSKVGYLKPLPTEIGGIRVYRPLLGFKKARLMATCKAANIEWFEDNSNKDPTVTTRNAIRHMYNSHSVPTALTAPSLLNLSEKMERNYNNLLKVANSCLEGTTKNLETRTGTMSICFPYLGHLNSSVSRGDKGLVAALILRQVITFVTPEEQVHLHALHGAVDRIFPEIFKDVSLPKPTAFTVSGVQFRPLRASTVHIEAQSLEGKYEWLISRQPYSSILSNRPNIRALPPSNSFLQPLWSPWTLYDGRFWFRIQNRSARSIVIRPFIKDDMATFMLSLDKSHQTLLRDVLKNLAPGDVRWTLPAIVTEELDGRERVLALPTLDVCALNMQKHVSWEVRYKKVDTGRLQYR
jgi:tRNA(Ile)-lysidine synthase